MSRVQNEAAWLRDALVAGLHGIGVLSPGWAEAFAAVPREVFVPRVFRRLSGGQFVAVPTGSDAALELIYGEPVVATQLDGDDRMWERSLRWGPVTGRVSGTWSAVSAAVLLGALDVRDRGVRVLEVGTGSAYGTALLCRRVGDHSVASVDVDPTRVRDALPRLAALGWRPRMTAAGGTDGLAEAGPYDRIVATCAVPVIPPAWLEQTVGGQIVAPVYDDLGAAGVVALTVQDTTTAVGRFLDQSVEAEPARWVDRLEPWRLLDAAQVGPAGKRCDAAINPSALNDPNFRLFAALRLPGLTTCALPHTTGGHQVWLLARDGSWALQDASAGPVTALCSGSRHLWTDLANAYQLWADVGRPERSRIGLSITAEDQWVWVDNPKTGLRWRLDRGGQV